jgi:formylglycine-generating enzyme required for sulfatase activity
MRQTFTASGVTFAIRYIPAGSFLMGSPDSDTGASLNQKPQRMVTITRGFWILETEVTQAQYNALVGSNPSGFKNCGGSCPVETMTWDEARNFANKLSAAQNLPPCTAVDASIFQCQGWRLPTEAEWEHAARAGTSAPRYGNTDDIAWHKGLNTKTQPVGGKQANAWGLYDMLGNVWEWTIDLYMDSHAVLGTLDPLGTFRADGATGRTRRGGGWLVEAKDIRAALRDVNGPTGSLGDTGFRLVRY